MRLRMHHPIDIAFGIAVLIAALMAAGHAVIYKRDSRSASIWVLVIMALPAAGPVLYLLMGINRVQRRAVRLRRAMVRHRTEAPPTGRAEPGGHLAPLARLVGQVVKRPLLTGNSIEVLVDGAAAYPAMLQAIETANSSIALASYIFNGDGIGEQFVAALARAAKRGVAVRVLVDDVDARFSWSSACKPLRRAGIPVGVFNPPIVPARLNAFNLRNHRKILIVDGTHGFTGGMNIDKRYWRPEAPAEAFRDLHFRLRGPVVAQLAEVFADDWQFSTDEALRGAP
jgi:cardiolipin synthase A/B